MWNPQPPYLFGSPRFDRLLSLSLFRRSDIDLADSPADGAGEARHTRSADPAADLTESETSDCGLTSGLPGAFLMTRVDIVEPLLSGCASSGLAVEKAPLPYRAMESSFDDSFISRCACKVRQFSNRLASRFLSSTVLVSRSYTC